MTILLIYALILTIIQMASIIRNDKPKGIKVIGLLIEYPYLIVILKLMKVEGLI